MAAGPAEEIRSAERSAAAVIIGAKFNIFRWEKAGATARRCHRHCAPSAMNSESPMAGRNRFFVTCDLG